MRPIARNCKWMVLTTLLLTVCLILAAVDLGAAESVGIEMDFDHQGEKRFAAYRTLPQVYQQGGPGARNLESFYGLRQYPGSPPKIPHEADLTVGQGAADCLSCHEKGGYSPEFDAYTPVTPHPENTLCYQCHVPQGKGEPFVASDWQSIAPPRLGRSALASSPPVIPHVLQLRENCVVCHTGPAAVVEIRITHADRGDCRQCHVPVVPSEEMQVFRRK